MLITVLKHAFLNVLLPGLYLVNVTISLVYLYVQSTNMLILTTIENVTVHVRIVGLLIVSHQLVYNIVNLSDLIGLKMCRLEVEFVLLFVLDKVMGIWLIRLVNILLLECRLVLVVTMLIERQGIVLIFVPTAPILSSQPNTARQVVQVHTTLTLSYVNA